MGLFEQSQRAYVTVNALAECKSTKDNPDAMQRFLRTASFRDCFHADDDGNFHKTHITGVDLPPSEAACSSSSTLKDLKFCAGMRVRILRLTKSLHLNGLVGHCAEYNDETGRWQVLLGEGDAKYIRPECLEANPSSDADDTLMANDAIAKDILTFAKNRPNNVPLDLPDTEDAEIEEVEQIALEESLAAGPEDSDDSDDFDEYGEYESFLDYIYEGIASLGKPTTFSRRSRIRT